MDIATLGVNIKYDSVKQAGAALDKFSQSGEKAEKATKNLTSATDTLKQVLSGLALGAVAMQAIKVADAYTQMQSKLRLVTQSTQELLAVQSQLNKVAVATFAEQGAVTELYAKMQPALAAMGKTTQDTVAFVEKFNKALALTNPSTAQAQAAILQFSQAMGSGVLRGDEFNSMMENANGVMQKLAVGLGVPIGALREMAHEGKLTADVVYAALNNATESINSDFDKMALTVSNASQTIETGMFNLVGAINNATGATSSLAEVMHDFGQVLNLAANYVDIYAQASAEAEAKTKGMSGILDTASQSATNLHDVFRQVASVAYDVGTGIDMIVLGLGGLVATMASVGDSKQMQIMLQDTRKELDMIIKRNSEFKESLNIKSQTAQTVEGLKSIDDELKAIFGSSYEAEKATIKFAGSNKEAEKAAKAHAKALKEQAKAHLEAIEALDKQVEAISKAEQAFRKYLNGSDFTSQVDELNEVTKAWKVLADNGLATTEDLQKAIDAVTMERFGTESQKAAEKMVENIDYAAEAMKASIKRLDDAFADVWRDIFNGAEDFGSSLQRWFTSLLAELAHAAITKPIVISMTGAMGIGGSGNALASSGGVGGFDILSSIGSMYSGAVTSMGTAATFAGSMMAGAGTSQAAMLAAQSGAFGLEGAALTTGALTGGTAATNVLSSVASAAPYIAAALLVDQLTGGAISTGIMGGARGERTRALNIGIENGQVSDASNIYRATHYDAGWGRSGSWNVDNLGGTEFNNTIKATVDVMASSIRDNAERLGFEFNEGFSGSFDADLFGKTAEETQQIIADTFKRIGQEMVLSVDGLSEAITPLQKGSETSYEALSRLTAQFDVFNQPIGRLNDTLATLNMTTISAVDSLVAMVGGMQNLQAMQSSFINAFYTDSQKAELTAKTVSSIFESIGMSAPTSREALVTMVQGLDLTTEAGQRAYVAITGATSVLDQYYATSEQSFDDLLGNLSSVSGSIVDTFVEPIITFRQSLSTLQSMAVTGLTADDYQLDRLLKGIQSNDQRYYATFEEYSLAQAQANVVIEDLYTKSKQQLTTEELMLESPNKQIQMATEEYERQVAALDETLAYWERQVNGTDTVNNSVLSVEQAVRDLINTLKKPEEVKQAAGGGGGGGQVLGRDPNKWYADWHGNTQTFTSDKGARWMVPVEGVDMGTGYTGTFYEPNFGKVYSGEEIIGGANWLISQGQEKDLYTIANNLGMSGAMLDEILGFEQGTVNTWAESQGLPQFATGGYTGNMATDAIAGVVHGREYVVNAKTTRDLGLNNQGGVFVQMANELMLLRQEVADLKAQDRQIGVQLIKQTRTTADTLDKWDSVGMPT